jgi:hypothetical protein
MHDNLMPWQHVFRHGVAPQLSTEQLQALAAALASDDPRLIQGATTFPPPLQCNRDSACQGADPLGFCFLTEGATVGDVEEQFARVCYLTDQALGFPAAIRDYLAWWDDTDRAEARRALLGEVAAMLDSRRVDAA